MNFAVIDLSNLYHRSRHSAFTDADTKVGLATLIVFRSLRKLYREFKIDHMVFAVDRGSWRYKVYPAYKSRRKLTNLTATASEQEENALFFNALNDFVHYLDEQTRCTVLQAQDVEGDDFIAHWIARHPDDQHIIVSGDSDFIQLIAPNVRIYDAINQRLISHDRITDDQDRTHAFTVSPKDGKLKVGNVDTTFVPEPEWWRKALFIKLIRGDVGDSIFAAYPGVRYEGKKCSIRAAWDDHIDKGYDWNNLMFQTWNKLIGTTGSGEPLTETVKVIDEFKTNQMLIDLTKQPDDIVDMMDTAMRTCLQRPVAHQVGINFLRFCQTHDQPSLAKEANDHVAYLNRSFSTP